MVPFAGSQRTTSSNIGQDVFAKTPDDEKRSFSSDDRDFLAIMEDGFVRGENGNWIAPLPFRKDRPRFENNLTQALQRARNLQRSLLKDTVKVQQFTDFMQKMLDNGHAEKAPNLRDDEEFWFLPIFAVCHPRKHGQARVVFDSSAQFRGSSLNEVLLTGPNLTKSLLGALLRFRQEPVAVVADVQHMFYCFYVNREHRNYSRFLWHDDNDPAKPLVHYRMCVLVFGNSPSPAVATYGLRKAVNGADEDVIDYVERNFYADDGLASCKRPEEAITLVKNTQRTLMEGGNIKLHNIASNKHEVIEAFPQEDLAKEIKNLDLRKDLLPLHTSLGIGWDLPADRLEPGPLFSNVGVDAFGPWQIVSRRTRGGIANSKRWGIIFICLVTRAVHIEVRDSMSSSAFINALRRFIAIRGKVNIFRSDRGTNFVGAMDDLGVDRLNVENNALREFFDNVGT